MDKLNNPVYIISLNNKFSYNFEKLFNNVIIYKAINAKKLNLQQLLDDKIISWRVFNEIENGRKDHFGFPGIGGIGLYLTHRKLFKELLNKNISNNVLICEEDCIIYNPDEFVRKIKLLNDYKNFDCAIFGSEKTYKNKKYIDKQINESNNILNVNDLKLNTIKKDFKKCNEDFYLYHSSLWSPNGIKKMNIYLNDMIEFQIDAYLSKLALNNKLNILLEKNKTTNQKLHISSLNNDNNCKLCNMDPNKKKYNKNFSDIIIQYFFLIILLIFCIIYILTIFK